MKYHHSRIWKEEEEQILSDNYLKYTQQELKDKFFPNKTVQQIRNKKMDMGLKKGPKWSQEEIDILYNCDVNCSNKEIADKLLPNKTNVQVRGMRRYYGLKYQNN